MRLRRGSSALLLALSLAIASAASAQDAIVVQDYQGVPYVTGGIGLEEREALDAIKNDFNLRLSFAVAAGNYLSDIQVRVRDSAGNAVLEATSSGPKLYAQLPPGTYTVEASANGQVNRRSASVTAGGATTLDFSWQGG